MKKLVLMGIVLLAVFVFWLQRGTAISDPQGGAKTTIAPTQQNVSTDTPTRALFVPYWGMNGGTIDTADYDSFIYFGVAPSAEAINKEDAGYLRLPQFVNSVDTTKETHLTLRMLNDKISFPILKDSEKQQKVIAETIAIAKENGFEGVVLDLEVSALPFDSFIQQINRFVKTFSAAAKKENLKFSMTIYGDTFYRIRPFDVQTIAQHVDQVMIMAYDLSKANGNPGPNFPLGGGEQFGYDYTRLIEQFAAVVPKEKLTVVFGLFGYDWPVDEKNISQSIGKAKSALEIQGQIIDKCDVLRCSIVRDSAAKEQKITYTTEEGVKHIVWFEDMESALAKQEFLRTKGILNVGFWAHSYF